MLSLQLSSFVPVRLTTSNTIENKVNYHKLCLHMPYQKSYRVLKIALSFFFLLVHKSTEAECLIDLGCEIPSGTEIKWPPVCFPCNVCMDLSVQFPLTCLDKS